MQKTQEDSSGKEIDPFADDPYNLSVPQAELELKPNHIVRQFTVTTDSYISMCSSVYKAMCLLGYGKTISESVFQYYAVSCLWQRLRKVGYKNIPGALDPQCLCTRPSTDIPAPLDVYLQSIGNYIGPDFSDRQFRMPTSPTEEQFGPVTGTFGAINANNHYFYESYPAPGIAVLRILADLKYTADPCQDNLIWDLPPDLLPNEKCEGISTRPTRNLLGWAPAQQLTGSQLEFLKGVQVTSDNFPTACKLHCQNDEILTSVRCSYNSSISFNYFNNDWKGSIVQGIGLERSPDYSDFDRNAMYCEGRTSVSSYHRFNNKLVTGAMISGYRMSKQPMYDKHCWSCYDFNEYRNVPASWIETRNNIYEWGAVGTLNELSLTTIPIDKKVQQNLHIQTALSISPSQWDVYG